MMQYRKPNTYVNIIHTETHSFMRNIYCHVKSFVCVIKFIFEGQHLYFCVGYLAATTYLYKCTYLAWCPFKFDSVNNNEFAYLVRSAEKHRGWYIVLMSQLIRRFVDSRQHLASRTLGYSLSKRNSVYSVILSLSAMWLVISVQTCSLGTAWERHLVMATEVCTVCTREVRILLECFLVENKWN